MLYRLNILSLADLTDEERDIYHSEDAVFTDDGDRIFSWRPSSAGLLDVLLLEAARAGYQEEHRGRRRGG